MEKENRLPGFYWVKRFKESKWFIAHWTGVAFAWKGYMIPEQNMYEIDEKQIIREVE